MVFWSDCEIKMPGNVVFRLNREIKMSQKFHAPKISCLKVRWSFLQKILNDLKPLTIFAKIFTLNVRVGSEYASGVNVN